MVIKVRTVLFGCGPVECSMVRYAWQRPDIEIVGAVDIDKSLVGLDLGEVAGINKKGFYVNKCENCDPAPLELVTDILSRRLSMFR